jgi:hypothetical protein
MATAKENLDRQVGEDNSNAIEALIDEKLSQRSEDLEGLRRDVVALREQIGDVDMPELRRQLNAAAGLLREAIDDHNEQAARRNAGEPVAASEVEVGEERVQRVSTELDSVRGTLEQRVTALEERLDDPDTGLQALHNRDDELQEQINELRDNQSTETTEVRTSKSGLKAALITFVVVFLLAWAIIMVTADEESWLWAVAWAGVSAGLVGIVVGLASKEGTRTNTFVGDWRDFRRSRRDERSHVVVEEDERDHPVVTRRTMTRERVDA